MLICPFCDDHVEFPSSAAGTTQTCPHCHEELEVLGSLVTEREGYDAIYFRCDWCGRVAQMNPEDVARGCECPHCHEENTPEEIAKNRLTTGQAERMGLLPEPGPEPEP
jgi:hypothetical protein